MSSLKLQSRKILKVDSSGFRECADQLALEEPLEIQLAHGPAETREISTIAVTMRTPGQDRELAAGFLIGEGMLHSQEELEAVHSRGPRYGEAGFQHSVRVTLRPGVSVDIGRLQRNFYTTSSCGAFPLSKTSPLALAGG
jgi:FdhD protein